MNSQDIIIEFKNVGEKFRLRHYKEYSLKEELVSLLKYGRRIKEEFWALRGISFEINRGEVVGVIGENGSGKTTILNLIAGILKPDEGVIEVYGRVSALLELGIGFHPELSGRENVYLSAAVLGLNKKVIDTKMDEIISFAELERFIDVPVKAYSAGMYMRLAFAVAININPDILLIDEAFAVGDEDFHAKYINKLMGLKMQSKTLIIVSHNMELVNSLCDRAILLKKGYILRNGPVRQVINFYLNTIDSDSNNLTLKKT
jgi:ABC-type polysaccharide/polyol phosphate transport system ATPase subunit